MPSRHLAGRAWGALAITTLLLACGGDGSGPTGNGPTPVASVRVTPETRTLAVGETTTLEATPRDASGGPLTGRAVAWASDDEGVAVVSAAGVVRAVAAGTTTVHATSEGRRGGATIAVTAPPPPPAEVASVEIDVETLALDEGAGRQLVAVAKDAMGQRLDGRAVQWWSNDERVAVVSPDGRVRAVRPGSATITATVAGKSDAAAVTVTLDVAYDLLFDGATVTGVSTPELYRLDVRVGGASPALVLPVRGRASDMTASPDGSRIAFVAWEDGQSNLYVVNRDGSGLRALTSTPESESQPAWSPDGTRIAYRRWSPGGPPGVFNPSDVWVTNADGTGATSLTSDAGDSGSQMAPAWSPRLLDGSYRIAYVHETRGADGYARAELRSMRADGQDKRVVTADNGGAFDDEPAWSPDGSAIVFTRTGPVNDHQLMVATVATGSARPLIEHEPDGRQFAPAWSPDGRFVAFVSNHEIDPDGYEYQVYTVRADGTHVVRRTFDALEKQNPAWIAR